jgi:hypothetical protein
MSYSDYGTAEDDGYTMSGVTVMIASIQGSRRLTFCSATSGNEQDDTSEDSDVNDDDGENDNESSFSNSDAADDFEDDQDEDPEEVEASESSSSDEDEEENAAEEEEETSRVSDGSARENITQHFATSSSTRPKATISHFKVSPKQQPPNTVLLDAILNGVTTHDVCHLHNLTAGLELITIAVTVVDPSEESVKNCMFHKGMYPYGSVSPYGSKCLVELWWASARKAEGGGFAH